MNDPHVEELTYRLEKHGSTSYAAPDLALSTPDFTGTLGADILTVRPTRHWATEDEARQALQPFISSWRIHAGLAHGRDDFVLVFVSSRLIDRLPTPNTGTLQAGPAIVCGSGKVEPQRALHLYPAPPTNFTATDLMETLWDRYDGYVSGREPLCHMAYYCLTLLELGIPGKGKGKRKAAAKKFNIEFDVLDTIGYLSSTKSDSKTARKASAVVAPLTDKERAWLDEAIKRVILHLGEGAKTLLTMASLPGL